MSRIINGVVYKSPSELEKENKIYDDIFTKAIPIFNRLESIEEESSYIKNDLHDYYQNGYHFEEDYIEEIKKELKELKKEKEIINKKLKRLEKRHMLWEIKWCKTRDKEFKKNLRVWQKRLKEFEYLNGGK